MAEEIEKSAEQPAPEHNERFKWYILHAYSGFERKVKESIQSRVQAFGLLDRVGRVMIPTEPVTEIINGKRMRRKRRIVDMPCALAASICSLTYVDTFLGGAMNVSFGNSS